VLGAHYFFGGLPISSSACATNSLQAHAAVLGGDFLVNPAPRTALVAWLLLRWFCHFFFDRMIQILGFQLAQRVIWRFELVRQLLRFASVPHLHDKQLYNAMKW
jgi:hypothetical protein